MVLLSLVRTSGSGRERAGKSYVVVSEGWAGAGGRDSGGRRQAPRGALVGRQSGYKAGEVAASTSMSSKILSHQISP